MRLWRETHQIRLSCEQRLTHPYLDTTRSGFAEVTRRPQEEYLRRCGQTEGINAEHGPTRAAPSRGSSAEPTGAEGTPPGEEKLPGVRGAAHRPRSRPPASHRPPLHCNGPSTAGPRGKASGQHTAGPVKRPRAGSRRPAPLHSTPLTSAGPPST